MSEFITTLMLNMIADFFTYWAINYPFFERMPIIRRRH